MDLAWPASARAHARGRDACCPRCAFMAVGEHPKAREATNYSCDTASSLPVLKLGEQRLSSQRGQVTIQVEPTGPILSASIGKLAGRRMRRL